MNTTEYILAVIVPPVAAYRSKGKISCAINIVMLFVFIPLGIIHAVYLVYSKYNIKKTPTKSEKIAEKEGTQSSLRITGNGDFSLEVVGESNYQPALLKIAGAKEKEGKQIYTTATIKHDKYNKYDENACAVYINELQVGHLPRDVAKNVVKKLFRSSSSTASSFEVDALIVGGWHNKQNGSEGHFGVKLDMN